MSDAANDPKSVAVNAAGIKTREPKLRVQHHGAHHLRVKPSRSSGFHLTAILVRV